MAGSAAEALGQAVERSKQLLLLPFKAEKWFALGFTVFLAQCGEATFNSVQAPSLPFGPSSSTLPTSTGVSSTDIQKGIHEVVRAFNADFALYVTLAVVGVALT